MVTRSVLHIFAGIIVQTSLCKATMLIIYINTENEKTYAAVTQDDDLNPFNCIVH